MKTDLFQSCGHCGVVQICWHSECSTFTASSFRMWNSSTGIPSHPLTLFVVMLSKSHLTSHSRMSGSRSVITPQLGAKICTETQSSCRDRDRHPGIWTWRNQRYHQHAHKAVDIVTMDIVSVYAKRCHRNKQQLSIESWADGPWVSTWSSYAETVQRALSMVWMGWRWPLTAHSEVHRGSSPSESVLVPLTLHLRLALDLRQSSPGRSMP